MLGSFFAKLGSMFANATSTASFGWWWDEPKCPKSLIK